MNLQIDEQAKRRLTERAELTLAAEFLIARGFPTDEIAVHLCRHYYVDIDELNDVVATLERPARLDWRHAS